MRNPGNAGAIAAAALCVLVAPSLGARDRPTGEEKLAALLEGRVAGEPDSCINTFGSRPLRVIDGTAIVYKSGGTVWVNRTRHPESLDDSDIMVIQKFDASSLCRLDMITTVDRLGGFYTGNIFLTDFIPYTKDD